MKEMIEYRVPIEVVDSFITEELQGQISEEIAGVVNIEREEIINILANYRNQNDIERQKRSLN